MKRSVAFILMLSLLSLLIVSSALILDSSTTSEPSVDGFLDPSLSMEGVEENEDPTSPEDPINPESPNEPEIPEYPDTGDTPSGDEPSIEEGVPPSVPPSDTEDAPTDVGGDEESNGEDNTSGDTPRDPPLIRNEITVGIAMGELDGFSLLGQSYMAGETPSLKINTAAYERNYEAQLLTGVKTVYEYYPTTTYKWGDLHNAIFAQTMSDVDSVPDAFVASVADIEAAALHGCFKNLAVIDGVADEYLIKTLSLDGVKHYAFGGDILFDISRAMYAIPYNAELVCELLPSIGDVDESGEVDNSDLACLFYSGEWSYERLLSLGAGSGITTFLVGADEISARGLLASSDFDLFGDSYHTDNSALISALSALSVFSEFTGSTLDEIKDLFCEGDVVFGGVTTLGALEGYSMGERLGIAPVPTYKSGVKYIASVARCAQIGAISIRTENITDTVNYINAANMASEGLFDVYVEQYFSGADQNSSVLSYMRSNLSVGGDLDVEDTMQVIFTDSELYPSLIDVAVGARLYRISYARGILEEKLTLKKQHLKALIYEYKNIK